MEGSWEEKLYDEVFQGMIFYLRMRRREDLTFNREVLEEMIRTEYVKHGNGWVGKSPIQEIKEAATIAAYEHYLASWDECDDGP